MEEGARRERIGILKLTLERDEVAESLRKEKGVLENDLKDANDAIAALTERINSEDSAIVLLEQTTFEQKLRASDGISRGGFAR